MATNQNAPETTRETGVAENARPQWVAPPVDVYENENEFLLIADVPGLTEEGLHIELDRGELRIEGARFQESHGTSVDKAAIRRDYRRVFTVPDGIDADNVKADLTQGVLFVHLPKAASVKPRKIAVKSR